jgi:hypothetical protein
VSGDDLQNGFVHRVTVVFHRTVTVLPMVGYLCDRWGLSV